MMDNDSNSSSWCDLGDHCHLAASGLMNSTVNYSSLAPSFSLSSNLTNSSCSLPFCVHALHYTIRSSKVRVVDLAMLLCNVAFLGYLLVMLIPTLKRLKDSLQLFKILYFMVFLNPVVSVIHLTISITIGYTQYASKVTLVVLRGVILMTELSVVVFGLLFKLYSNRSYKLAMTVLAIVFISVVFTIAEGLLEFLVPVELACTFQFKFFTHGGMIWLFTTSLFFAVAYFTTFFLYLIGLHKRWDLPSKKSFYRYALFLSLVNTVQAIGSMLWYRGKHSIDLGHTGICLTLITTIIYVTTFAPVVYWIFLSNYFRMNKPSVKDDGNTISIGESGIQKRPSSGSQPILTRKRSYFEEHAAMLTGSLSSSASSYGSLIDEEEFVRQQ